MDLPGPGGAALRLLRLGVPEERVLVVRGHEEEVQHAEYEEKYQKEDEVYRQCSEKDIIVVLRGR